MTSRSERRLRLGVIGSGFAARTVVSAASQSFTVGEISAFGGSGVQRLSATYGVRAVGDLPRLLESVDAVVVATPHDTHAQYVEVALAHGCDVLCEKPFVTDPADGEKLIRQAEQAKLVLSVNHFQRYRGPHASVMRALSSDTGSEVLGGQASLVEAPPAPGWKQRASNRGFVFGYGIHVIDLLCWWLKQPVAQVSARSLRDGAGVERCTVAQLAFAAGARIGLTTSDLGYDSAGTGQPGRAVMQFVLLTSEGLVDVDSYGDAVLRTSVGATRLDRLPSWEDFDSPVRLAAYRAALEQFTRACRRREAPEITAQSALDAVRVCAALEESAGKGGALVCVSYPSTRS